MSHGAFDPDDEAVPAASFAEGDEVEEIAPAPPRRSAEPAAEEEDPLAAPAYSSGQTEEPEEEDEGDGGFSDEDRLVRVWLEDGRLVKNRISPVWFTKLGPKDSLHNHFREALMMASLDRAAQERDAEQSEPAGPMEDLAALPDEVRAIFESLPFTLDTIEAVGAVAEELGQQYEAAVEAEQSAWAPRSFSGRSQGVTVTVDEWGNTSEVDFDEQWLDQAQVGSLVTHVQHAADRAHEKYVPRQPNEALESLDQEQRLLSTVLTAILNPRKDQR
ncbi:hypothetical protein [Tessaracoccus flavescens]|uniref:Uncharacterized protein n=1 Tax=Tessaracoccus flavescens TaxID=399497 RepID=A0A1Q2CX18_9ACTN|nr:hypothetical protein [Tessaracoccus flavescens]AQP50665.1 hypothetical protein BW733_07295 [Tessaracoccus flavescens]